MSHLEVIPSGSPLHKISGSVITRHLKKGNKPVLMDLKPVSYVGHTPYFNCLIDGHWQLVSLKSLKFEKSEKSKSKAN